MIYCIRCKYKCQTILELPHHSTCSHPDASINAVGEPPFCLHQNRTGDCALFSRKPKSSWWKFWR